jgi:hypothetical protein
MGILPDIVVATSIPPKIVRHDDGREVGQDYQRRCIASWMDAGFRVLSLNAPDEIADLALRHPAVRFIATERDARKVSGRKLPLIIDMLAALARQPEPVKGIINADIWLEPGKNWRAAIGAGVHDAIVVAHRIDVGSLSGGTPAAGDAEAYRHGYDLCFFEDGSALESDNRIFAMGLPWWDYWLPIAFMLRGQRVRLLDKPFAFHLRHPTRYDTLMLWLGKKFAEFVVSAVDADPGSVTPDLVPVVKICRGLARTRPALRRSRAWSVWTRAIEGTHTLPLLWRLAERQRRRHDVLYQLAKSCTFAIPTRFWKAAFNRGTKPRPSDPHGNLKHAPRA